MALPQDAYANRQFLAVIGDEVRFTLSVSLAHPFQFQC